VTDERIFMRVAEQIRQIAKDREPGAVMPPIDFLASEAGCSRHTVGKAYGLIAREGLVTFFAGQGYFVRGNDPRIFMQIATVLRGQIERGELRGGARLPSIDELGKSWVVSRPTAGKALRKLAADGLIVGYHGVGFFVPR
jgi:DNA-binding GntR family transcriptional regulator